MTTVEAVARWGPPAITPRPAGRGVLQRTCDCGGTPGPTGECAECRKKRSLRMQRVQRKLRVNCPGDRWEREADAVATQVMRMPGPAAGGVGHRFGSLALVPAASGLRATPDVGRIARAVDEDEDRFDAADVDAADIDAADADVAETDVAEETAAEASEAPGPTDAAAFDERDEKARRHARERVMEELRRIAAEGGGASSPGAGIATVQRKGGGTGDAHAGAAAPAVVDAVLGTPGAALDAGTRAFMEPRFGRDFSRVRVHTGARAAASARAVDALAYTAGWDVVFADGQYAPSTPAGRALIAHELTHVVQQNGGGVARSVQRLWGSPAGGCGLCYGSPALVGVAAHALIEQAFLDTYAGLETEYPVPLLPSPIDSNARLDLYDPVGDGDVATIGEIKPANFAGLLTGDLDLLWYEDQIAQLGDTVGRMNLPPPFGPLSFPTLAPRGCTQHQALYVDAPTNGVYTYWCLPDYTQLVAECNCKRGKRRKIKKRCLRAGCPKYVHCGDEKMVLENCGSGTCRTCPRGRGNLWVKGWCTYASKSSEQRAILLRMRVGGDRLMCGIY
jgi:hypothetical protein